MGGEVRSGIEKTGARRLASVGMTGLLLRMRLPTGRDACREVRGVAGKGRFIEQCDGAGSNSGFLATLGMTVVKIAVLRIVRCCVSIDGTEG